MSFPDLHEHIQQTFAQFSGADEYEAQLSLWCYRQRAHRASALADWKAAHPERQREHVRGWQARNTDKMRGYRKGYLKRKPAAECRRCKLPAVIGKRECSAHLESERARTIARKAKRAA